jgi:hypothetical protein
MLNGEGDEQSRVSLEEIKSRVNGIANDNQLCQRTFSLLNVLTNLIGSKPCSPIAKPPKRFNISAAYNSNTHFQYGFMVSHDLVKSPSNVITEGSVWRALPTSFVNSTES